MRVLCIFLGTILLSSACRDKIVCPAFQSTYILDDSTRLAYYSAAWQLDDITRQKFIASLSPVDTTGGAVGVGDSPGGDLAKYFSYVEEYVPPATQVRKNKYGIVKYEPYWMKTFKLKSAPMENVLGPEEEVVEPVDEGEFYASDFASVDSLGISLGSDSVNIGMDSLMFATDSLGAPGTVAAAEPAKQKYRFRYDPEDNFNVEQDYYNKYFGILLLDLTPPPSQAPVDSLAGNENLPDSLASEKGFFAGIKGLFKKKNKEALDESLLEELPDEGILEEELEEDPPEEGEEEEEGGN